MPDLAHTLQGHDLNFLKIVAGAWGVELNAPDARTALPILEQALLDAELTEEIVSALPADARQALQALVENEGQMSWALFARRFGEVRSMGAAARDRERPDLKPVSPAEVLWYRSLIGRAFLNSPLEPQEYAYIPDDLLELFSMLDSFSQGSSPSLGRPASPAESSHARPASDRILDQACSLLAALRLGLDLASLPTRGAALPVAALTDLLAAAGMLDGNGLPLPEPTRAFLEAPRPKALAQLAEAWMNSASFNDLRHIPDLCFEGEWQNDPLHARQALLQLLSHLPQDSWWSLPSFVAAVKEVQPDFQRPAGDYDSWFVRKAGKEEYLRGFGSWDEVDGALVRWILLGPLYALGLLDLAAPSPDGPVTAFRSSAWGADLWHGRAPQGLAEENAQVKVQPGGHLLVPRLAPRAVRYQIARFCIWQPAVKDEYHYQVTPEALERAGKQGLKPAHLLALLRRSAAGPLPPTFVQSLERWEQSGVQARLENVVLLQVSTADVLVAIRQTRAARLLGDDLNPTTAVVKAGQEQKLIQALSEAGYLAEARLSCGGSAVV